MNKRQAYMICNAHLDPVWLWEKDEGLTTALATFRVAADFCEEYDWLVFNHNEALLYDYVRVHDPALFVRIQRLVRENRWHIIGGWYIQPDCNMPSGESLVRQILTGRRFFQKYFAQTPTTAINFDPFGHSRALVQILSRCGYDSYLICRPNNADCPLPANDFRWRGYDGSEILVRRCEEGYNSAAPGEAGNKIGACLYQFHPDDAVVPVLWGIGDHGGGPSREDIESIRRVIREHDEFEVVQATPERYFAVQKQRREELPVVERSLNPFSTGCYTSMAAVKQRHRALENQIYALEKMAAHAAVAGLRPYPAEALDIAQKDLMFNQFHDVLPGSCIRPGEEEAVAMLDHGLEETTNQRNDTMLAMLAGQPKAADGELPLFVYNPHPYPVDTVIGCEYQLAVSYWDRKFTYARVYDENGNEVVSQMEAPASNVPIDWRKNSCFRAHLKPSGVTRFDCRFARTEQKPVPTLRPENGCLTVKTDRLTVKINTATGTMDSYVVDGIERVRCGACQPLVIRDSADSWGMTSKEYRQVAGRFSLMSEQDAAYQSGFVGDPLPSVRVIEEGPVRVVIEAMLEYHRSTLTLRYSIPREGTAVGLELETVWNEPCHMLKLSLPIAAENCRAMVQTACGREDIDGSGRESVMQKWAAVYNGQQALTVINRGIHGVDFDGQELRLSLLRSPGYSVHPLDDRDWRADDRCHPHMDLGRRSFAFELCAGTTDERMEHIEREAQLFNERPYAINIFPSGEPAEKPGSLIELTGDEAVVMTACKQAADGNGYILRLYEPTGRARRCHVAVERLAVSQDIDFAPFELKTFRLTQGSCRPCTPTEEAL